jgi:hypothetical protein
MHTDHGAGLTLVHIPKLIVSAVTDALERYLAFTPFLPPV